MTGVQTCALPIFSPQQVADQPLKQVLTEAQVDVEEFWQALDRIDWNAEVPVKPE